MKNNTTALVIVDIQNDFCEKGALAITGGNKIAAKVADLIIRHRQNYDLIVTTQDWHIDPGTHFEEWPIHCQAHTPGAEIKKAVIGALENTQPTPEHILAYKGQYSDGYSGMESVTEEGIPLTTILKEHNINTLHIVGLATDFCVKLTALDGLKERYNTKVISELTAGVDSNAHKIAQDAGVEFISLRAAVDSII